MVHPLDSGHCFRELPFGGKSTGLSNLVTGCEVLMIFEGAFFFFFLTEKAFFSFFFSPSLEKIEGFSLPLSIFFLADVLSRSVGRAVTTPGPF